MAVDLPANWSPQLATLVKVPPEGPGWVHELKHDGYRMAAFRDGDAVRLVSRNGRDWTATFPELVEAVRGLPVGSALFDGEVVIVRPDGRTSFQALQNALAAPPPRGGLTFFVFDLLHLDGEDLTTRPLSERKARLRPIARGDRIRYSDHLAVSGAEMHRQACRLGAEGIVSKRLDAPYRGGRSRAWLKTKCVLRQELVIGGFTEPGDRSDAIGALLVGYRQADGLWFAGKVGTGFTDATARALRARLEPLRQDACPFAERPAGWLGRSAHWVRPELVAEVAFTEWTAGGHVRHPSFQGLREDKPAAEVRRERAVRVSHPERVVFPELGLTKGDLADYYEAIAPRMLPHLRGRPLTLFRCPGAIGPDCYFMKHSKVWAPDPLRRVRIQEKTKIGEYLIAETADALVGLAQMDVIEVHTWNSRDTHLEQPDRVVVDLDPGPGVPWAQVVEAARTTRRLLEAVGLRSFVKTTGGTGLHVVVPLVPDLDWRACLAFARAFAESLVRRDPSLFTTSYGKLGRHEKILVDYLRNNRTNTSVAAFSIRARPGAPVSVPIGWDELSADLRSDAWNVRTVIARTADPWEGYDEVTQRIGPEALEALAASSR